MLFKGCKFAACLDRLGDVARVKRQVLSEGATWSYMVTKEVTHMITSHDVARYHSLKIEKALSYGCVLVNVKYVEACLEANKRIPIEPFLIFHRSQSRRKCDEEVHEIRLFISSTFMDMKEEREAFVDRVFPQIQRLCDERDVRFSFVDLRWGVTEEQTSSGETLKLCLELIDSCRPYFLCFLGERYGWHQNPDEDEDVLLTKTIETAAEQFPFVRKYADRSITEIEVLHAALRDKHQRELHANDKRALFYFRDPRYVPPQQSADDVAAESAYACARQRALKERIRSTGMPFREAYSTIDQFVDWILEDLTRVICSDCAETSVVDPLESTARLHHNVCTRDVQLYVKRSTLYKKVDDHVRNGSTCVPLVLTGRSGSGKTALIGNWLNENLESNESAGHHVVVHTVDAMKTSRTVATCVRRVFEESKRLLGLSIDVPQSDAELLSSFSIWMNMLSSHSKKVIVFIDGLDKVTDAHEWSCLPHSFPSNVRVVCTLSLSNPSLCDIIDERLGKSSTSSLSLSFAPPSSSTLSSSSDPGQQQRREKPLVVHINGWNELEKRVFVEKTFAQMGKSLRAEHVNSIAESPLTSLPLFTRSLLQEIALYADFDTLSDRIWYLLESPDLEALFEKILTRWETTFRPRASSTSVSPTFVVETLRLLAVSLNGLSESELLSVLGMENGVEWNTFRLGWSPFIISVDGCLRFMHPSFAAAVTNLYLVSSKVEQQTHLRLFHWYEAKQRLSIREALAYPHHARATQRSSELLRFFSDPNVLQLYRQNGHDVELVWWWRSVSDGAPEAIASMVKVLKSHMPRKLADATDDSAENWCNIGFVCRKFGLFKEARSAYEKGLEEAKHLYGEYDSRVLNAQLNVCETDIELASYEDAISGAKEALERAEAMFGCDADMHIEVSRACEVIGLAHKKCSDYESARSAYERAVAVASTVLGEHHHKVALLHNLAADVNRKMGHYDEAAKSYLHVLRVLERCLGASHPDVAEVLKNLGLVYKKLGQYTDAEPLYVRAIRIISTAYHAQHPKVGVYLNDLADLYRKQEDYMTAEETYERALVLVRNTKGDDHPDLAEVLNSMALVHKKRGSYAKAASLLIDALRIVELVFGRDHVKYGMYQSNLADAYRKMGKFSTALELYSDSLTILKSKLGESHEEVAEIMVSMGMTLKKLSQYRKAEALYVSALPILHRQFGEKHAKVGVCMVNLGDVYRKLKMSTQAHQMYSDGLGVLESSLGANNTEVADCLYALAILHTSDGQLNTAERLLLRALQIVESQFGLVHYKKGMYLNRLGEVFRERGNVRGAEHKFKEALIMLEQTLGDSHPEVADVLLNLADLSGSSSIASATLLKRGQSIVELHFGAEHPKYVAFGSRLQACEGH